MAGQVAEVVGADGEQRAVAVGLDDADRRRHLGPNDRRIGVDDDPRLPPVGAHAGGPAHEVGGVGRVVERPEPMARGVDGDDASTLSVRQSARSTSGRRRTSGGRWTRGGGGRCAARSRCRRGRCRRCRAARARRQRGRGPRGRHPSTPSAPPIETAVDRMASTLPAGATAGGRAWRGRRGRAPRLGRRAGAAASALALGARPRLPRALTPPRPASAALGTPGDGRGRVKMISPPAAMAVEVAGGCRR